MPKFKLNKPLTERGFEKLIDKASQPILEWNKPYQVDSKTSVSRPSDGHTDKCKNQDKIEGIED